MLRKISISYSKASIMVLLLFVLSIGISIRWIDLDRQFTHVDDVGVASSILQAKQTDLNSLRIRLYDPSHPRHDRIDFKLMRYLDQHGFSYWLPLINLATIIPCNWTYAPAQFFITIFLLSPQDNYRLLLFWGRFPSFIFGILSLILTIFVFKIMRPNYWGYWLLGLTLMSCSWESIIYAKHMSNYEVTLAIMIALIGILVMLPNRLPLTYMNAVLLGLLLGISSYWQYQFIFIAPALIGALVWFEKSYKNWRQLSPYLVATLIFGILVLPILMILPKAMPDSIPSWNGGLHREFIPPTFSWSLSYWISIPLFFIKNGIVVLSSMITFIPESSRLFPIFQSILAVLFSIGFYALAKGDKPFKQTFAVFSLIIALIWIALILSGNGHYSLGPTRHNLILLPIFVIILVEGVLYCAEKWKQNVNRICLFLSMVIIACFLYFLTSILHERRDPFNEQDLKNILKACSVDLLISYDYTLNINLMSTIRPPNFAFFDQNYDRWTQQRRLYPSFNTNTIAFIGSHYPLTKEIFNRSKVTINTHPYSHNKFGGQWGEYQLIYKRELSSNVEMEFSKQTKGGYNGLFLYILKKRMS